ncbi:MAG: rod shape-determining protein MreC [Actinomycetales bacterium]|nr:rod shape-determining protein MreC [Actinomycetales bacterium]
MTTKRTNRTRLLLVSLLVTSLFLITLDLRGLSVVSSLRTAAQSALTPFQSLSTAILSPISNFLDNLSGLRSAQNRVAELERENQELRNTNILNENVVGELKQLKGVLDLAGRAKYKTISARVIGKGGTATIGETIIIDKGSASGISTDMTVISENGLVGVVKSVSNSASIIMLMSDPNFRLGVRVAGSQLMGILSGEGGDNFSLQMLSASSDLSVGDVLLSRGSSGDKPFVPGVPVGRVSFVENSLGQLTKKAKVEPYVDFNSLGVVSVVLESIAGDPGDALVPKAPRPAPTITVFVTPTPNE